MGKSLRQEDYRDDEINEASNNDKAHHWGREDDVSMVELFLK